MTDEDIIQLKLANPIEDVARRLGLRLFGYGDNTKSARCFKHEDKHPSLVIEPKAGHLECKSCGISGDVIDLVREHEGLDFNQAIEWLGYRGKEEVVSKAKIKPEDYLAYRGIRPETAEKFSLKMTQKYGRDCLEIPLPNGKSKYRFLTGERFLQDPGSSCCLFKIGETESRVILGEGELDVIRVWQETGYSAWTGTTGAPSYTEEFFDTYKADFAGKEILIATDRDEAGDKAAEAIAKILGPERCRRIVPPPEVGKDWCDFFDWGYTRDDFDRLINEARPIAQSRKDRFLEASRGGSGYVSTGVEELDRKMNGGFRRGCHYVLGGMHKCGKSSFLITLFNNFLSKGIKVGYLDTELSERDFINRAAANQTGEIFRTVEQDSKYGSDWLDMFGGQFERAEKSDVYDDKGQLSPNNVIKIFNGWRGKGIEVFIFDNLTTFNQGDNTKSEGWQRIGQCFTRINDWAKGSGGVCISVLHTHDLNISENTEKLKKILAHEAPREIFDATIQINRRPTVGDLYGDKAALSQLTGGTLLLWRPFQDFGDQSWQGHSMLILADMRTCPYGDLLLWFDGGRYKFSVLEEEKETEAVPEQKPEPLTTDQSGSTDPHEQLFLEGRENGYG